MWIAKLKWKHDCILGNRCEKFNVKAIGYPLDFYKEGKNVYYLHFQRLFGDEKDVKKFILDLKKDKRVKELEVEKNSVFFSYEVKEKVPTSHYSKKTFFLKPVIVDEKGYELWEVASWDKGNLTEFIENTKKETSKLMDFKVLKIEKTKLAEIYFPRVLPSLSKGQRRAFEIAVERGYYDYPRNAELDQMAKQMGISLSTYREHLRRAEKKLVPDLLTS